MLSVARTGEEYFALRMASQAAVKVFGNPMSRPHLPWSNGQTQVESARMHATNACSTDTTAFASVLLAEIKVSREPENAGFCLKNGSLTQFMVFLTTTLLVS